MENNGQQKAQSTEPQSQLSPNTTFVLLTKNNKGEKIEVVIQSLKGHCPMIFGGIDNLLALYNNFERAENPVTTELKKEIMNLYAMNEDEFKIQSILNNY